MPIATDYMPGTEMTISAELKPEKKAKKNKVKDKRKSDAASPSLDVASSTGQTNGDAAAALPRVKKVKKLKVAASSSTSDGSSSEQKASPETKKTKKKKRKSETPLQSNGMKKVKVEVYVENGEPEVAAVEPEPSLTPEQAAGAFSNFRISEATIAKLKERGITYLFPVQSKTFDYVYDGYDVIAQARTGTGKTFSFAIPLVEKLIGQNLTTRGRPPKVLVMTPTRELAKQVAADFQCLSAKLLVVCVYGGTPYGPQADAVRRGIDVVVGTPGRILDLCTRSTLNLGCVDHVVLDEVDRMLDMGFAESVEEILAYAYTEGKADANPQTCLFSATLPVWVHQTAKKYMRDTVKKVDLIGQQLQRAATNVQHLALRCGYEGRAATIGSILQVYSSGKKGRAIVFCETKRDADELALSKDILQATSVLHGDIPQSKRESVLKCFRDGGINCLIATDVAARGLDIPEVELVIQCNPPKEPDSYIHRSGRTGRAGRSGVSICFYQAREEHMLRMVEKHAGFTFKKIGPPTPSDIIKSAAEDTVRLLDDVPTSLVEHFTDSAVALIASRGAVLAVASALAALSGGNEIKTRSLLNASEGYTTYLFTTDTAMGWMTYCWRSLEKQIPSEVKDKVTRMRITADKMGCVFDLPSELDATIAECWTDTASDSLVKATEMPDLVEHAPGGSGGRGRGGRGRFGGFGGRFNSSGGVANSSNKKTFFR